MSVFNDIKEGILPTQQMVLYIYKNKLTDFDNKEEIEKYITILNNAYLNSTTEEKILLNRVIFVLELLIQNQDAIKNFIKKAFFINIHDVDEEYSSFINDILISIDEDELFNILNDIIKEIFASSKEELRSYFNWLLHKVWNISKFHNSFKFKSLYPQLKELLEILKKQNRIDEMMFVEFFTYHIMGNNFQTKDEWREFNKNITQKTISAYNQFISQLPKANPKPKPKKRIAFIKDRIVFNSPYKVEYSLFKNLMGNQEFKDNFELIVYTFNQFEKSDDDETLIYNLEKLGIKVKNPVKSFQKDGYYNNHLDKALTLRQSLIDDEIDIMIAGGVFPILNFLYVTRSAPLQIYYSHGNCTYDVPNIDKRISHFNQECKEFEWNIINIPIDLQFLVGTQGEKIVAEIIKNDYKQKFGNDLIILGSIGRLVKIDSDEYIETISKIMKDNPNTIYLACGVGNEESIKEKLHKYNIDEKKFIFTGMIKAHVYGWIIDVYLAPFKSPGQSLQEYMYKGKAYVLKYHKFEEVKKIYNSHNILKEIEDGNSNFVKADLYTPNDINNLKAKGYLIDENPHMPTYAGIPYISNNQEFINLANRLIKDSILRNKIGEEHVYKYLKVQNIKMKQILKEFNDITCDA